MSDKMQHTAASLRDKMIIRYGDGLHHKHDKNHLSYRKHFKSHPCIQTSSREKKLDINGSTGLIREFNLKKMRKRLDKGRIH